jgi:Redoxin
MRIRAHSAVLSFALLVTVRPAVAQVLAIDTDGHSISQLATAGARAVVLVFAAADCPISNRYVPEIEQLRAEWQPKGVTFWWVFPNPGDTVLQIKKHQLEFAITTPALIDTQQILVHIAHVTVTPEAAAFTVTNGQLHEVYHGRIDNRYLSFGHERPLATRHDLEEAIRAALEGSPVPQPENGPVGCSIVPTHLEP